MNDSRVLSVVEELRDVLSGNPDSVFELESGASFRDILSVESLLGLTLPPSARKLLQVYNGQRRRLGDGASCDLLLPSLRLKSGGVSYETGYGYFCGIEQMLLETLLYHQELDQIVRDGTSLAEYNDTFLKLGEVEVCTSMLVISHTWNPTMVCIDLAPDDPERSGQVVAISEQPNVAAVLAPSLEAYLETILSLHRESRLVASIVDGARTWRQR